ncbi:dimethylaniline monooxygenase 2 [Metarhizium rileyi]|uniref:Dimethylaniline monooxygenase 2 n=1 Tax=Metarhizium rileyi (strain RCEF 4871) TaxID=1649241 RepID=A0A167IX54_METRR|nr:dimethylaniline monooxygenase 2 [Metarhizium rileyi RCEF 4871]
MALGTVAVIGLGPLGLVTLKNLLEKGFEATGFDRADAVGGLWNYRDDDQTTVLESTVSNISKQRGCFTDFPFSEDTPIFPEARHVQKYLCDYAAHFSLQHHIRLQAEIVHLNFDEENEQWTVGILQSGEHTSQVFDKIVLATGINKLPLMPKIDGLDMFEGDVFHSAGYKRPSSLRGKTVLIVGMSNSAADTATTLVGHAKHVYISRRHDMFVFPRFIEGQPMDHAFSHRKGVMLEALQLLPATISSAILRKFLTATTCKGFPELPQDWDLGTAPLLTRTPPIISDTLVSEILKGSITLVRGLRGVTGSRTVQLEDGSQLEVDSIVFCTGYKADYSLAGEYDPTLDQPQAWTASPGSDARALPRLYRNIFSLKLPHHLAFMGAVAFASPAFQLYDLASMALARIWGGQHQLPTVPEMTAQVDQQRKWLTSLSSEGTVIPGWVHGAKWMAWVDEAAGSDVFPHLGYGIKGWTLWLKDRQLSRLLMDGISSPHQFRLFENGKRRVWSEARNEILRTNIAASHTQS